jgi:hypothetical protein
LHVCKIADFCQKQLTTNYAAVAPGSTVSTTVKDGMTGGDGVATFTAPRQPGCYLYKATALNAI